MELLGFDGSYDVLRGFVGDAGDGVGVVEELPRAVGQSGGVLGEESAAPTVLPRARFLGVRGVAVVGYLEHLAFDDAADAVQISAPLALEIRGVHGLLPQPEEDAGGGQNGEAGHGSEIVPIREKLFHRLIS
jgi:hypothetical protein